MYSPQNSQIYATLDKMVSKLYDKHSIETEKLSLANDEKVSFVPAVIVASPFEDNVAVKCLLTLKLVSVRPEFAVVFNVLAVLYGNLNNEILFIWIY